MEITVNNANLAYEKAQLLASVSITSSSSGIIEESLSQNISSGDNIVLVFEGLNVSDFTTGSNDLVQVIVRETNGSPTNQDTFQLYRTDDVNRKEHTMAGTGITYTSFGVYIPSPKYQGEGYTIKAYLV